MEILKEEMNPYAEGHYIVAKKTVDNTVTFLHSVDPTAIEIKWHEGYKGTNPEQFRSKDSFNFPYQLWKHVYSKNNQTGRYTRRTSTIAFMNKPFSQENLDEFIYSPYLLNTGGYDSGFSTICFGYQTIPGDNINTDEDLYDNMLAIYNAFYFSVFNKNMGIPWKSNKTIIDFMEIWKNTSPEDVLDHTSEFFKSTSIVPKLTQAQAL